MLPGRLHQGLRPREGRGDAALREMAATGPALVARPAQNPAYRPAPPVLVLSER